MQYYARILVGLLLLFSSIGAMALKPTRVYKHLPSEYNMDYEEVTVVTRDNARLNAWYFENEHHTQRTMLICHNGEGNMGDYLDRVDEFLNLEYNVVIFDYRGYGKSSPFGIDPGMYIYPEFIHDLEAMIKYCRSRSIYPLLLYGWGPGAGLALGVGYQNSKVDYIISDSPFLTLKGLQERLDKTGHKMEMPAYPKLDEPLNALDWPPAAKLKGILLLVGDKDPIYGAKDLEVLKAKHQKMITLEVLPGVADQNGFEVNSSYYFERVKAFLDQFDW